MTLYPHLSLHLFSLSHQKKTKINETAFIVNAKDQMDAYVCSYISKRPLMTRTETIFKPFFPLLKLHFGGSK
jgi:hypothetical protein